MTGAALIEITPPGDVALAEHAAVIRALGKRVVTDVIEIGRRLVDCRAHCKKAGHGKWTQWLRDEFDWGETTANRFIDVHSLTFKTSKLEGLDLPISGLYLLAAPSTPEPVRDAVIERAEAGEKLTLADVQRAVDDARLKQAGEHQAEVARLRAEAEQREAAVRAEYEGKLLVEPGELQAEVDKVVAPLKQRAERLQEQIDAMKRREQERIEADRAERSKKAAKGEKRVGIDAAASLNEMTVRRALADLAVAIAKITPDEAMAIAERSAQATAQTTERWIGDSPEHAKAAIAWLTEFLKRTR